MKQQFDSYLKALNEHDIEKALSFYSQDFELQFTGSAFILEKEDMIDVLGWDKGVNGKVSYDNLDVEGDSIAGLFTEQNDFFELLGIEELKSKNVYWFDESGLIVKQTYKMLPGQPSFEKKMKPAAGGFYNRLDGPADFPDQRIELIGVVGEFQLTDFLPVG